MTHDLFPSGAWTGFYNYSPKDKHRMDLDLTFTAGKMSGNGNDDVGRFKVLGDYSAQTLECSWTKTYVGAHSVFYRGFREGKGIWGTWELTVANRGGFHIWPKPAGEGDTQVEAEEQTAPGTEIVKEVEPCESVVREHNTAKSPQTLERADLSALSAGDFSPPTARSASNSFQPPAERGPALATSCQSKQSGDKSPHSKGNLCKSPVAAVCDHRAPVISTEIRRSQTAATTRKILLQRFPKALQPLRSLPSLQNEQTNA